MPFRLEARLQTSVHGEVEGTVGYMLSVARKSYNKCRGKKLNPLTVGVHSAEMSVLVGKTIFLKKHDYKSHIRLETK